MLPFGAGAGAAAYKRLLLSAMAVNLLGLYGRHGKPKFNSGVSWSSLRLASCGRRVLCRSTMELIRGCQACQTGLGVSWSG